MYFRLLTLITYYSYYHKPIGQLDNSPDRHLCYPPPQIIQWITCYLLRYWERQPLRFSERSPTNKQTNQIVIAIKTRAETWTQAKIRNQSRCREPIESNLGLAWVVTAKSSKLLLQQVMGTLWVSFSCEWSHSRHSPFTANNQYLHKTHRKLISPPGCKRKSTTVFTRKKISACLNVQDANRCM